MSANNTNISKSEYVLKLLPDLTVFDLVEEYFINNKTENGFHELFFYYDEKIFTNTTFLDNDKITFRRFIVRYDDEIEITPSNGKTDYLTYDFSSGLWKYNVIIDENLVSGGFIINKKNSKNIIGVCF